MKSIKSVVFLALSFATFVSCQKGNSQKESSDNKGYTSNLPNFGNVELKDVFTKNDSHIENEGFVTSFLNQYYSRVWEKGDLWGGILVAKGDEIVLEK